MEILSENSTNWVIRTGENSIDTKTKHSDLNQLLYGENLWGLLDTGDEIWVHQGKEDEPKVSIIPGDNAKKYTLKIGDAPELVLGKHQKTELITALQKFYDEGGESVEPLVSFYDNIRENLVRQEVLAPFLSAFGNKIEERDDGWFIHNHLLLTFEGGFYHPNTTSRKRSGNSIIQKNSAAEAYRLTTNEVTPDMEREITHNGETIRLTNSEMQFLGKAIWAIENAIDPQETREKGRHPQLSE